MAFDLWHVMMIVIHVDLEFACYASLIQVGVTYNVDKAPPESSFDFVLAVFEESTNKIELRACSKWTEKEQESGMVVMDIGIPSGFELDWDKVQEVRIGEGIYFMIAHRNKEQSIVNYRLKVNY